jgi:phenylpyruvate tautomerase PptA (4-oxalocrotonate tautomerase family)
MKNKKVTLVIQLVEKSAEKTNAEIKEEIIKALSEAIHVFHGSKKLKK